MYRIPREKQQQKLLPKAPPAVNPADPKMPIFDSKLPDYEHLNIEPRFEDQVDFEIFSKSDFRAVKAEIQNRINKSNEQINNM